MYLHKQAIPHFVLSLTKKVKSPDSVPGSAVNFLALHPAYGHRSHSVTHHIGGSATHIQKLIDGKQNGQPDFRNTEAGNGGRNNNERCTRHSCNALAGDH